MIRSVLAIGALAALATPAPALARSDFQQWATASVSVKASDAIRVQNELVARFSDDRNGLYEIENSLLVGYKLNTKVTAWAGYVHNPNYNAGDFTVMERRAREQLTFDNIVKLGEASLSARLRLEQRWRDGIDGTGWRVRPYLRLGVPLGGKGAPTLNLTSETFLNLNSVSFQSQDGLDRIRTAASLSFPLSKTLKLEAGYLNQHRFVRSGPDNDDHALTGTIGLSF
jgi:hypothetical protein